MLYLSHVQPWLHENEIAIDDFISSAHERAKAAGLTYLRQGIEWVKQQILGLPPKEPTPPSTPSNLSYAQSLMARFNLPSARPISNATSTATDFYTLLQAAVSAATSQNPASRAKDLSNSGTLIPPSVSGAERLSFIAAQRERLAILLSALDKEAETLTSNTSKTSAPRYDPNMLFDGSTSDDDVADRPKSSMSGISGLSTRKSEPDFEKIEAESEAEENSRRQTTRTTSGSWLPWSWGAKGGEAPVDTVMGDATCADIDHGKSSGVDA